MGVLEEVKKLHSLELYDDVKIACNFMLTGQLFAGLSLTDRLRLLTSYGDALFQTGEFNKAESFFKSAMELRKVIKMDRSRIPMDLPSEVDLRFKLYQVHLKLRNLKEAITMLEGIPNKSRTAVVNKSLAQLYHETSKLQSETSKKRARTAITLYKEVLRECPLAMDAIRGLLTLGVKSSEVLSLCLLGEPSLASSEWFVTWVNGQAQLAERNFASAVKTFQTMEASVLSGNSEVYNLLGEAHYHNSQIVEARMAWKRARHADPMLSRNMDCLAFMLIEEKSAVEVENLSSSMHTNCPDAVETQVVDAMYCIHVKRFSRGLTISQKVLDRDPGNYMATLVKGLALVLLSRPREAVEQFRGALLLDQYRWEGYKFLVDAYIHQGRVREAIAQASNACKLLGQNSRTCLLYGKCMAKDPANIEKAKQFLDKAVKLCSTNTAAVHCLGEILLQQKKYTRGIDLLRKVTRECYSSKLYKLLGDFFSQKGDKHEALQCYDTALRFDPMNQTVKEASEQVARSMDGVGGAYERGDEGMMVDALNDSDDPDAGDGFWT